MCTYYMCFAILLLMCHLQLTGGYNDINMLEEFENFKQKYQKVYSTAEGIFDSNICSCYFSETKLLTCHYFMCLILIDLINFFCTDL